MNSDTNRTKEKIPYQDLIAGSIPPWVMRFIKKTGKAINTYDMIRDGDTVLMGVSGGKDSLALALALSIRRSWLPISYHLEGVMINWLEHPISEESKSLLHQYFSDLSIPFTIIDAPMHPDSFQEEFNCYLCSRNRRRILFEHASEKGHRIIAMGHHLDDLVETSLINLCFRSSFSTMLPAQDFFDGKLYIVRPMIEVHEHTIIRLAEQYTLPVVKPVCPYDQTNIRSRLKPIIQSLSSIDKLVREHIYNAHNLSCKVQRQEEQQDSST